ncbi:extra spindle pole bodies like 1, separase isoform X2 [Choristoneura fumiferana]|uniref:extra spindle pole bodies like 1, separase isoform X2 n=1 Tax=Choristoneura fumiferana TaxID=7141 RepID=UPI003D157172
MEDFDLFSDEINFTRPDYKDVLSKYVNEIPATPSGPNYQSGNKLMAEEYLAQEDDARCAFHLSEAVSASLRTMAMYRDDQLKCCENKLHKISSFVKPIKDIIDTSPIKEDEKILDLLSVDTKNITEVLSSFDMEEDVPFHKKYLKFSSQNNVDNFKKILNELPKEWTVIQLTAQYNPNENLKPFVEYSTEISSIYLSMFTNDFIDQCDCGPITVNIPANVPGEGVKPLFTELYALLDDNYRTIDNARLLNNKRLVQNYWSRREDIDLRMKSVIHVMDRDWLGGWGSLLTGRLVDASLRDKVIKLVDSTIDDWGFIRLTTKQRVLLYNLIESSPSLSSQQIKPCIRRILTEHGRTSDIKQNLVPCTSCSKDFRIPSELCLKCLMKCFEAVHKFTVVDGIRAFSQAVMKVREDDEFAGLRKAKRQPVVLIVDEILDTFPWESLPVLSQHPVSRIENIHFLYSLYKMHEDKIVDGYFAAKSDVGRYVINPENNLERMEKRMSSFIKYWCGSWSGHVARPPPPHEFVQHLTHSDIFLYCGHGDGCQLGNGGCAERAVGSRCVALLAGCGSVRLTHAAARGATQAAQHRLRLAASPMVVGMLWEVTDLEVDKMVSTLVSLYVPSDAKVPWPSVGKANWSKGVLDTSVEQKQPFTPEPDLLRAVSRARGSTNYVMIASSMVARGLPIRIVA